MLVEGVQIQKGIANTERLSWDGRFRSDSMSNLRLQGHAWSGFASSSSSSSSLLTFSRLALNNVIGFVKVNSEIETNIQVTREIESDIVKCSEIESSLSVKESDLTRSFLASQYELTGLISVTGLLHPNSLWIWAESVINVTLICFIQGDSRNSLKLLDDEIRRLRNEHSERLRRITEKR